MSHYPCIVEIFHFDLLLLLPGFKLLYLRSLTLILLYFYWHLLALLNPVLPRLEARYKNLYNIS
jgi:hypothetical protein